MKKPTEQAINNALENIAKDVGHLDTLETRMSDRLDFYDMSVWTIKNLMREAYEAGYKAGVGK